MRSIIRRRLEDRTEEGFTLIELMVVVLIIAILLAIAIPTFLGARTKAQDRAAQSDLRNALTAEKTFYVDSQAYSSDVASGGALQQIEPHLAWAATSSKTTIGVGKASSPNNTDDIACLSKQSASGTYFAIWESASAGTYFGSSGSADPLATCPTAAPGAFKASGF